MISSAPSAETFGGEELPRSDVITLANPPVQVHLRRLARARRLTLRLDARDGRVHLTVPSRHPRAAVEAFLEVHRDWLTQALARVPSPVGVAAGAAIPLEGRLLTLASGPGRAVYVEGDALVVPGPPARFGPRTAAFLKTLARDRLAAAADRHASALRRAPGRITLRDPRSRWGSCNSAGDLMFSWRLIMAPVAVLDYVAAHEAAHLVEMNHSPRFWKQVERLVPDLGAHRLWLRQNGPELLRYRFS